MDMQELRRLRKELEVDITVQIDHLVDQFRERTGFSPHHIGIDMIEFTEMGNPEKKFRVGRTSVQIEV